MSRRYHTQEQYAVLDGLRAGRRIRAIVRRRKDGQTHVVLGFSAAEPVHAAAIGGLVARGHVAVSDDGEIVLREEG